MSTRSITFKSIVLITIAFVLTALSVVVVADYQLRTILDRSQSEVFSERLGTILGSLDRTYQRLQDTLLIEAYEEDFRQSFLAAFRSDYYDEGQQQVYPFIVDGEGRYIAHPQIEPGERVPADPVLLRNLEAGTEGDFDYAADGQRTWVIFRHFDDWDWAIGYMVPEAIKYADARSFRNMLILIMAVITVAILAALSVVITRYTRSISRLTEASAEFASGNLEYPVEIDSGDELGILARSFVNMRDAIRQQMSDLAEKNRLLQLEIGERKRAEEALRESEIKLRAIFENSRDAIAVAKVGTHVLVNPAYLATFGYAHEDELVGQPVLGLISPEHRTFVAQNIQRRAQGEQGFMSYESRGLRKDGSEFDMAVRVSGYELHEDKYTLVVLRDITEQKQLEAEFRQAQKMEAIGRLAGGVAHDFNNLLTVIRGYTDLLMRRLGTDDPMLVELQEIQGAADRARTLTSQLLAFGRKQVLQPRILDLNVVITGMEKMLGPLIGEDIALQTTLAPGLGRVRADPGQIEQVIMNLAINARDAMPHGGQLCLETQNVVLDEAYCREHLEVEPGAYVLLAVQDTGRGIADAVREHLFEPFFTTKARGKGTGLGLATVYGIVKQSGGHVSVHSELGKGTTFGIYLPQVPQQAEPLEREPASRALFGGTETILLVEDEETVRELACEVLAQHGYTVLTAGHPDEALRLSRQHPEPIHLLLTDVVMPGMGGAELAQRLKPSRPGMKVLYTSGYTDNAIVHHGVLDREVAFLQKPFTLIELTRKVRQVLDGR